MLARLTVYLPFKPSRSFLVRADVETVIGRDLDCGIVLDDDRVSRRHARLACSSGSWRLDDLDSKNGTTVGGRPIRSELLEQDGWVSFGGLIARFERTSEERERADGRRREERLRSSISRQRELSPSLGLPRLLEKMLGSVLELTEAERGVVLLRGDDGAMEIAVRSNLADSEITSGGFSGSVGAIERAVTTVSTVAVSDALADSYLQTRESVIGGGIRSLICVPLVAANRLIGVIYADSRSPGGTFGELDVQMLESLASHAALAIASARVDLELKRMASRLPGVPPPAPETANAADARSAGQTTSWEGILAHHRARSAEGP